MGYAGVPVHAMGILTIGSIDDPTGNVISSEIRLLSHLHRGISDSLTNHPHMQGNSDEFGVRRYIVVVRGEVTHHPRLAYHVLWTRSTGESAQVGAEQALPLC